MEVILIIIIVMTAVMTSSVLLIGCSSFRDQQQAERAGIVVLTPDTVSSELSYLELSLA